MTRFPIPSSFRVSNTFHSPRRSLPRLRSFHLSPAPAPNLRLDASLSTNVPIPDAGAASYSLSKKLRRPMPAHIYIPIEGSTFISLAIVVSLFFIMSISFAFLGAEVEDPYFRDTLNNVARTSPGLALIGESVDVDIDEPSITIRWSILACGKEYVLPESLVFMEVTDAGFRLSLSIYLWISNGIEPAATYDPSTIPITKNTGQRRNIQNLVQFDSDHVLDVHNARLYPFDTYFLTSTIRAVGFSNDSIPIRKLATVDVMSSFDIGTMDVESFSLSPNGTLIPSRDLDLHVARPGSARFFTLIIFAVNWILTHITIGHVIMARRLSGMTPLLKHLVSSGAILMSIPQLRSSMPDAPGFDGVLVDTIGYFPQMVITSISVIVLLLILAVREFDLLGVQEEAKRKQQSIRLPPRVQPSITSSMSYPQSRRTFTGCQNSDCHSESPPSVQSFRPPPVPSPGASPAQVVEWEQHRMQKLMTGEFVFPPIALANHKPQRSGHSQRSSHSTARPLHRRMTRLLETEPVRESQTQWFGDDYYV